MFEHFLFSQLIAINTQVMFLVMGIFLLLGLAALLYWQLRQRVELKLELKQLEKVKKNNVEYEFVLKTMKLLTWHVDLESRTITFDNDYREGTDSITVSPETPVDEVINAIAPADRPHILKTMDDLLAGRVDDVHEVFQVKKSNGIEFYWTETYATIAARTVDGMPNVILGTSKRVDDRKTIEQALVEARNKAEESDRLKSAFIANMSHEIRTPLNAIIGFTSVLPELTGDEERKELICLIQKNNQKLLQIIDDVMSISKIEAEKSQLVKTSFDLNKILRGVMDIYSTKVQPGVEIFCRFAKSRQTVTTDLDRLVSILNHLLLNAIKFTSKGSIVIGYDMPVNQCVHIWVRDTGKGIAPEFRDRIFERFFKVDEYVPGAGLGLSICKTMAYSIGGNIGVDSVLGEGSNFWVEIPIE